MAWPGQALLLQKLPETVPEWIHAQIAARRRASERASARATCERDTALEARLRNQDRFHHEIYEHAVERVSMLLTNKEHFIATRPKTQPHVRKEGKQRFTKVKFLEQQLMQPGRARGHVWVVHKGHYKCSTCSMGLHKGLPWRAIKKAVHSDCTTHPHLNDERLQVSWPADSIRPVKADKEVSKLAFLEESTRASKLPMNGSGQPRAPE